MSNEELEELFSQLRAAGYDPMLCDTPIDKYDVPVKCGDPTPLGDSTVDIDWYPRERVNPRNMFKTPALGNSMIEAGIEDGDWLTIRTDVTARDGDIVMVSLNDNFTVKALLEDDNGDKWLVPYNNHFTPIRLTKEMNIRIVGRVVEVSKENPRVSSRDSLRIIKLYKESEEPISTEKVESVIVEIAPQVKTIRQWFSVFRAMTQKNVYGRAEYEAFCLKVTETVPEHPRLPIAVEVQRMDVDSFRKYIALWDESDAPVSGKRFRDYQKLGERTLILLSA